MFLVEAYEDKDEDAGCKRSKLKGAVGYLNVTKVWPIHLQVFREDGD